MKFHIVITSAALEEISQYFINPNKAFFGFMINFLKSSCVYASPNLHDLFKSLMKNNELLARVLDLTTADRYVKLPTEANDHNDDLIEAYSSLQFCQKQKNLQFFLIVQKNADINQLTPTPTTHVSLEDLNSSFPSVLVAGVRALFDQAGAIIDFRPTLAYSSHSSQEKQYFKERRDSFAKELAQLLWTISPSDFFFIGRHVLETEQLDFIEELLSHFKKEALRLNAPFLKLHLIGLHKYQNQHRITQLKTIFSSKQLAITAIGGTRYVKNLKEIEDALHSRSIFTNSVIIKADNEFSAINDHQHPIEVTFKKTQPWDMQFISNLKNKY